VIFIMTGRSNDDRLLRFIPRVPRHYVVPQLEYTFCLAGRIWPSIVSTGTAPTVKLLDPAHRFPKPDELLVALRDSRTAVPFQFDVVGVTIIAAVLPKPVLSVGNTLDSDSGVVA
jgi:hypothetical protein